jgi:hypothetical protein
MSDWLKTISAPKGPSAEFLKWFSEKIAQVRAMPMPLTEAYLAKIPPAEEEPSASPQYDGSLKSEP